MKLGFILTENDWNVKRWNPGKECMSKGDSKTLEEPEICSKLTIMTVERWPCSSQV